MTSEHRTWVTQLAGSRSRALMVYTLTVTRGAGRGTSVTVAEPQFRVGALPGNGLQLEDPSVSGLHVELSHDPQGIRVRDLGSRNGTRVDGVLVRDAVLTDAATLTLGATELRFEPGLESVELPHLDTDTFGPLLGRAPVMHELFARIERFAATDSTVLLCGETGVGKEAVAEALLQASPRAQAPLVVVDCSALTPTLVESELFGHEKGAFTGATSARVGAFERAQGGTVFLDEVGELPLELQPRLLRVLERREVQRVGGSRPVPVDVRIFAATNRALEEEVNRGRFRADLFYRLSVLRLDIPPLRERREDVPLLAQRFAGGPLDAQTLQRFATHDWPGNVRELRNAVERWKAGAPPVTVPQSTPQVSNSLTSVTLEEPFLQQKERLVVAFERQYAQALLAACKGNLAEGARLAGVSRMAVVKMLSRLHLLP